MKPITIKTISEAISIQKGLENVLDDTANTIEWDIERTQYLSDLNNEIKRILGWTNQNECLEKTNKLLKGIPTKIIVIINNIVAITNYDILENLNQTSSIKEEETEFTKERFAREYPKKRLIEKGIITVRDQDLYMYDTLDGKRKERDNIKNSILAGKSKKNEDKLLDELIWNLWDYLSELKDDEIPSSYEELQSFIKFNTMWHLYLWKFDKTSRREFWDIYIGKAWNKFKVTNADDFWYMSGRDKISLDKAVQNFIEWIKKYRTS